VKESKSAMNFGHNNNSRFHVLTLPIILAPNQAESVPNAGGSTLISSEMYGGRS
jgi:hypothetical protein